MAVDAVGVVAGPAGERETVFKDFPVGYLTSAVEPNEVLTAIRFTAWPAKHGYAFVEFARRHGDFAIVSAATLLQADDAAKITPAAVTRGGIGTGPARARALDA